MFPRSLSSAGEEVGCNYVDLPEGHNQVPVSVTPRILEPLQAGHSVCQRVSQRGTPCRHSLQAGHSVCQRVLADGE